MQIISIYLLFSMLAVLVSDTSRYIIPNWLVASLLLLYPAAVYLSPTPIDWMGGLYALGISFVVGYLIFAMRWMGGGDIKLIMACSLWVGVSGMLDFLFLITLVGGLFGVLLLVLRKAVLFLPIKGKAEELPRILRPRAPIPYGVAIASSFLYMLWIGQVAAAGFPRITL